MSIISLTVDVAGQTGNLIGGVAPRRVALVTSDSLATITTAGYLNNVAREMAIAFYATDVFQCWYSYVSPSSPGTYSVFTLSIVNGVLTLVQSVNPGDVLLPVVSGDFAVFNGTAGQLKDNGYLPSNAAKTNVVMANGATILNHIGTFTDTAGTLGEDAATAINGGNIQAGLSGTAGKLTSFPSASSNGSLSLAAAANSGGNFSTTISNAASVGQNQTVLVNDVGAATGSFITSANAAGTQTISSALTVNNVLQANQLTVVQFGSVNSNPIVVSNVVTATHTALATAGKVNIYTHTSGTSQIAILDLKVFFSTGLSGGGGNRLLSLTDGTLVFNTTGITAALLGTPIFTLWGGTGNPLPSSSEATVSTAGADVYLQYISGTTDYSAGQVIIAVMYAQVTN